MQRLFEGMLKVDKIAKETFAAIIETIEKDYPGFKQVMYGKHDELTVITKIVRYKKTDDPEQWGTTAHFDKSGLSLIWDSNDDDDDSLLICEDTINPSMEELIKPTRMHSHKRGLTSAILIPGLALAKVGVDMKATLHGVAPIQKEYRYAVISFALIPDISMSDLKTDFI